MGAVCLSAESDVDGKKGILGLIEHPSLCQEVAYKTTWRSLLQGIPSAASLGCV